MLDTYLKSRGTEGTKMSAIADLITVMYVQQGKAIENKFFSSASRKAAELF